MNRKALWIKFTKPTLALALLFNFILPALCASLCAANLRCPAVAAQETKAVRSCCESRGTQPSGTICAEQPKAHCCEWIGKSSLPDVVQPSVRIEPVPVAILPTLATITLQVQPQSEPRIFASNGRAPPGPVRHRNQARAPPIA